jgi:dipicolinate synthase subunit B
MSKNIGWAFTGSYCTLDQAIYQLENLMEYGYKVYPIASPGVIKDNTRFGNGKDFENKIMNITGEEIVTDIIKAEEFGPIIPLDAIVVAPTTGNTVAKLAHGITDTPVTMAVKATLRNKKPVVLAIATNDAISTNGPNIMALLYRENYYLVPLAQDDPIKKPNSLIAKFGLIIPTLCDALNGKWNENTIPQELRAKMLRGPKR